MIIIKVNIVFNYLNNIFIYIIDTSNLKIENIKNQFFLIDFVGVLFLNLNKKKIDFSLIYIKQLFKHF